MQRLNNALLVAVPIVLAFVLAVPSILAQAPRSSSRLVLDRYLKAVRAQDDATLATISIVETIPFLLGYEVVAWRDTTSKTVDFDAFQARHAEFSVKEEEAKAELGRINQELVRLMKENDQLYARFRRVKITKEEYEPAKNRIARERGRFRTEREKVQKLRSNVRKKRQALIEIAAHYKALLRTAMAWESEKGLEAVSRFTSQSREAIADLQLQSRAGMRLFKKYSIVLKRPIVSGRTGRWVVTELNDLSD